MKRKHFLGHLVESINYSFVYIVEKWHNILWQQKQGRTFVFSTIVNDHCSPEFLNTMSKYWYFKLNIFALEHFIAT